MFAATKAFSTFGRRDLGDPFWANVSLLVQPPALAGGTNKQFVDSSANGFTVTAVGDVYQTADSPVAGGGSAVFDGSGDYLEIPNSNAFQFPDDFTLEAWIRPSNTTGRKNIFSMREGTSVGLHFRVDGTDLDLNYGDTNLLTAANSISANAWQHVAACRSGSTLRVFVDGVVKADRTWTTSATTTAPIRVGMLYNPTDQAFAGEIADARIVKSTALYTANFTVPTAPLTAVSGTSLLLNMGNGKILDKSPQSNTVTVVGDAQTSTATPLDGMGSVTFDGSGDRLEIANNSIFNFEGEFTVEAWVNYTETSGRNNFIFYRLDGPENGWMMRFTGTNLRFYAKNTSIYTVDRAWSPSLNTWYHVAAARDSSNNVRLFVDGQQLGAATVVPGTIAPAASTFYVGTSDTYAKIADARITKGVARYTQAFTPPTKPLPAIPASTGSITATGGTITESGGYRIHTFTSSGTFTVASNPKLDPVEYLVVAGGGGGGGAGGGGGGGAGGLLTGSTNLLPQAYSVTVGAGGAAGGAGTGGSNGANSGALGLTAIGGGGGGYFSTLGKSGGSGGGSAGSSRAGGAGTTGQGNAGGNARPEDGIDRVGAGGGGAGEAGEVPPSTNVGGAGGDGIQSSITGTAAWYAGGGGGGPHVGTGGAGGQGGGGKGSDGGTQNPTAGAANTGGGGGGGGGSGSGQPGGSGIVIIRYPI